MNHVTYDQNMTMSADCQEDACNSKKGKHLLTHFRTCILPPVHTGIQALGKIIVLCDIELCRFFSGEIFIVSGGRSLTCTSQIALMENRHEDVSGTAVEILTFLTSSLNRSTSSGFIQQADSVFLVSVQMMPVR